MKRYGLIGRPLGHSFSRTYFQEKFEREGLHRHRYDLFELPDIGGLPRLLEDTPDLCGLNVTIPYKQSVLPFLQRVDPLAAAVMIDPDLVTLTPRDVTVIDIPGAPDDGRTKPVANGSSIMVATDPDGPALETLLIAAWTA